MPGANCNRAGESKTSFAVHLGWHAQSRTGVQCSNGFGKHASHRSKKVAEGRCLLLGFFFFSSRIFILYACKLICLCRMPRLQINEKRLPKRPRPCRAVQNMQKKGEINLRRDFTPRLRFLSLEPRPGRLGRLQAPVVQPPKRAERGCCCQGDLPDAGSSSRGEPRKEEEG